MCGTDQTLLPQTQTPGKSGFKDCQATKQETRRGDKEKGGEGDKDGYPLNYRGGEDEEATFKSIGHSRQCEKDKIMGGEIFKTTNRIQMVWMGISRVCLFKMCSKLDILFVRSQTKQDHDDI